MKNNNVIISSLECCMGCACLSCAYNEFEAVECKDELIHDALMLVNRLTREKNKISKGEYISREALLEDIQAAEDHGGMGSLVAGTLKRYVKRIPAVDVEEAKRVEWISVDERLPEGDNRVLVYLKDNPMSYTRIDTDRLVSKEWIRWGNTVSHWMPLPEPPKMKGGHNEF